MSRRYLLRDREILTPDAVRAILAKELLFKASKPVEPLTGHLIAASHGVYYATFVYTMASDSADQYIHEDDSLLMMLASEDVLRDEWDTPEEDEAWADLLKVK